MMGTDRRAVHHDRIDVISVGDGFHDAVPVTCIAPAVETVVDGRRRAVFAGQISPWNPGAQNVENAVDDTPVIHPLLASCLVGQDCLDELPLKIAHV